jgi:hypothetical protein
MTVLVVATLARTPSEVGQTLGNFDCHCDGVAGAQRGPDLEGDTEQGQRCPMEHSRLHDETFRQAECEHRGD